MAIKFSNLASTTLASGVSDTATSLSVTSASSFPSLGGSDYFYASIGRGSGSEIVKVTALSGTTLTVVRGQDDTTAISHASGVEFALRVTAASLNDLSTQADTESVSIAGDTMTGALTVPALDITGNTTTSGTIDGRDVAADGTKLDGIESGATADQTASEIKAAYESNSDTNAFTDADESKLGGIESGATADQTASEIKAAYESNSDTNAFTDAAESKLSGIEASADVTDTTNVTAAGALMDSEVTNLTQVKAFDSSDYATAAQGTTADDALPKSGGAMTGAITTNSTFDGRDVATDGTKLDGIEANATADQTNAEIRAAVEAASDSNAFTDADHSKLNAIEAGATADQTAAEIKTAYESNSDTNAFTDADHSKLNGIAANANNYVLPSGYATENYVNTQVTNLVDSSPATLNTLNELAAALGDDPNFATTTANSIGTKAALSGAAFTGAITTNSTIDGRDVATDGTKLDGIEASADVTDTANVTAAGALMDSELTAIASVKGLDQGVATTDSPSFVNLTLSGTGSVKVPSGTTAQRDGSPVNGMFRYNSTNEQFEGYQSGDWGAIGGGGGSNTFTADTFTADGATTAYALSQVINSENNLLVFIDGVFQQQSAYSIATASGTTTLTFSTAPANTREIIVYSVASAVSGSNLNTDSMTGDGSDVTLALSIAPVSENNTQVFIDGVYQNKDTYSISGTTLTFSTAPPAGSAVEVMTMTQTEVNVPVDGTITSAKLSGDLVTPSNLTVTGTATMDGLTVNTGSYGAVGAGSGRMYGSSSHGLVIQGSGTTNDFLFLGSDGSDSFRIANNGDISFYEDTGATAKFFWDASAEALAVGGTNTFTSKIVASAANGTAYTSNSQLRISGGGTNNNRASIVFSDDALSDGKISYYPHVTEASRLLSLSARTTESDFVITGAGNVGIGKIPETVLDLQATDNLALRFYNSTSFKAGIQVPTTAGDMIAGSAVNDLAIRSQTNMLFATGGNSERMRISSAGNVGIGTGSPSAKVDIRDIGGRTIQLGKNPTTNYYGSSLYMSVDIGSTEKAFNIGTKYSATGGNLVFEHSTNDMGRNGDASALTYTERMRIDSSGYVKASVTGSYINTGGTYHETIGNGSGICYYILNSNSNGDGVIINTKNDSTNHYFLRGYSDSTVRDNIYIYSNGNILNRNNSYGAFSDQNLKQDIEDASSQWEDVKAMKFRKYRWKQDVAADADAPYQLGVIAQELESAGMNGLVEETADKEFYDEVFLDEDGNPVVDENGSNVTSKKERLTGESTKSVKYSILTMKALKALQEAMDRIETLETRIAALEG
jgi:hypothetical protein